MDQQRQQDLQRLEEEFRKIDLDGDGKVDKDEMNTFLGGRGIDEEHRGQIVEELFSKCDIDGDGRIDIQEYTQQYLETMEQLTNREQELQANIMNCHRNIQAVKESLRKAKQ